MELFNKAKQELLRSNADKRHPFRFFVLGTVEKEREIVRIAQRTVVKRKMLEDFSILVYTDTRSPKIQQLKNNNEVSALFYHPKKQLQVRVVAQAILVDEASNLYQEHLAIIRQSPSIKDYQTTQAPSSILEDKNVLYTDKIHFSLIQIVPYDIDVLQLDRAGHQRAKYHRIHDKAAWTECLIVP